MREAFEEAGVWIAAMQKDIAAAEFTRQGDPLKMDCGYQPNGVLHMFHALSSRRSSEVNAAKALAFSYCEMREGLMQKRHG